MKAEHPGRALEVGCGTGNLARFFEPKEYVGVDLDSQRVELARKLYPEHEFLAEDATALDPSWAAKFAFAFCHGCIHHIDDRGVSKILNTFARASEVSGRPMFFLIMEPLLPENALTNLPGYVLAKLDRGRFMRKFSQLKSLAGNRLSKYELTQGPWYWPVAGTDCLIEFPASSQVPTPFSQEELARRGAHA